MHTETSLHCPHSSTSAVCSIPAYVGSPSVHASIYIYLSQFRGVLQQSVLYGRIFFIILRFCLTLNNVFNCIKLVHGLLIFSKLSNFLFPPFILLYSFIFPNSLTLMHHIFILFSVMLLTCIIYSLN